MAAEPESVLRQLNSVLLERKKHRPADSYTTRLLDAGLEKIGSKLREESNEVIEAAGEPGAAGREHTVREAADVVYHLLVLLVSRDVAWAEVEAELARRFGISGLEEKASRRPAPPEGETSS